MKLLRGTFCTAFVLVTISLLLNFASAAEIAQPHSVRTEFNGVELESSGVYSGDVSESVPVRVTFTAAKDSSDVRVRVYMEGHRDNVLDVSDRFEVLSGGTYTKLLRLDLPSDSDELFEAFTLYVEIVSATDRTQASYNTRVQRVAYTLEILSVEYPSQVSGGETVPVSVVAKNTGYNRADDNYVTVSIPALDVSARGYIGDLVAIESGADDDDDEDSAEKTVFLRLPENVAGGVYDMEVVVTNDDTRVSSTELISVQDSLRVQALAADRSKTITPGETEIFDLIIVNSGNSITVFELGATSGSSLDVSVPSIVTVGPEASKTVEVIVTAARDAQEGRQTFTVGVDGNVVAFSALVEEGSTFGGGDFTLGLVVVLAIIFVVLVVVLITLLIGGGSSRTLSRREVEESYY